MQQKFELRWLLRNNQNFGSIQFGDRLFLTSLEQTFFTFKFENIPNFSPRQPQSLFRQDNDYFYLKQHFLYTYSRILNKLHLRGPGGSKSGGSWKLVLWCFLTEDNEIYRLLFTSSKNIDPNQSYRRQKVGAHV